MEIGSIERSAGSGSYGTDAKHRKLQVALVAPELFPLPPTEGFSTAIEFLIQELGEALSLKHDVTIYSVAHPFLADGVSSGIRYRYTPVGAVDKRLLPRLYRLLPSNVRSIDRYWQSTAYFASYAIQVALKIRSENYDVVHVFNILQFVPWIRRLAPHSKIVFHIAWHGLSKESDYFGYSVLRRELAQRCLRDVDAVIGCSDYLVDGIRRRFPEISNKLFRVYNGVKKIESQVGMHSTSDSSEQGRSAEPAVIFAGRIVPEKGLHVLMKAMRSVWEEQPRARLQIVGVSWRPGAEFSSYEHELQTLARGVEDRIEFLGWKSRSEFSKTLALADVYAFPSVWEEPFSMALLEAMVVGLPCVATAIGGTPELIRDGQNGFLVPADDAQNMAARILALLRNPKLRRKMGNEGRALVARDFCWERIQEDVSSVYLQVLNAPLELARRSPSRASGGGA